MLILKLSLKRKISCTKGKNDYFLLNSETFKNLSKPNSLLQDRMSERRERDSLARELLQEDNCLKNVIWKSHLYFLNGFKRYSLGFLFVLFSWNTNCFERFLNYFISEYRPRSLPSQNETVKIDCWLKPCFKPLALY